jgi:predicted metal-dependent HD superfamily phosphohydrolase
MDEERLGRLAPRWLALFTPHGVYPPLARRWFGDLAAAYENPTRSYHNLVHLEEVLDVIDELAGQAQDLTAVRLAGWFHDVRYDPHATDNEERSAVWAGAALWVLGATEETIARVQALILQTKTHDAEPGDDNASVLLDADLAILGAPPWRYEEYAAGIRREYAWVGEEDYRRGRLRVLEGFLQREKIYRTERMCRTHEEQARENVRREVEQLHQNPSGREY